jgi:hypothetical protein
MSNCFPSFGRIVVVVALLLFASSGVDETSRDVAVLSPSMIELTWKLRVES